MSLLPGPGTWLIFGIVLVPVYVMVLAWFFGAPRDVSTALRGLAYLIAFVLLLWIPMYILSVIIGVIFF
ncbi:hypothetical protein OB919_04740 [Halobacteria archaeon AArc-curdl1]|uniref:Uncharacterized protein n=1 Tax=Natronosalvus hydrolyticus TaxID=2979988 RepID=A0AAP2Z638_9EURY|nr:hypothetical protein [Halobacteria archaeon AArc-curdl1]